VSTSDTVFLKRLYVLFFIHVGSRRIVRTACTGEPNGEWVTQQARNALWQLAEEATEVRLMLHDRDRKFSRGFDTLWEAEGARVMLTPLMAPKANAYAERWVGSARRECLDWMLMVGQRHLSRVLGEYVTHYNTERPHRSRGLMPLSGAEPAVRGGPVVSRPRLGGLTHEYSRQTEAA
jgi:transposase InsO family protein